MAAGLGLALPDFLRRTRLLVDFTLDGPGTLLLPSTTSFGAASPWLPWADFVGTWAPLEWFALLGVCELWASLACTEGLVQHLSCTRDFAILTACLTWCTPPRPA
jgi:hypothetical protein